MKSPAPLPTIAGALRAVAVARAMLAEWITPVCRGHLYPMRIRRRDKRYFYYAWERCVGGRRIQRTVRLDQVERIAAGIRAMAGLQARLDAYCNACDTLALVETAGMAAADEKKSPHHGVGGREQTRRPGSRRHGTDPAVRGIRPARRSR